MDKCRFAIISDRSNGSYFDTQVQTTDPTTIVHYSRTLSGTFKHSGDQSGRTPDGAEVLGHFVRLNIPTTDPILVMFSGYAQSLLSHFGTAICAVYVPADAATLYVPEGLHVFPLYNRADEVGTHTTQLGLVCLPDSPTTHTVVSLPVQGNVYTGARIPHQSQSAFSFRLTKTFRCELFFKY